MKIRPEHQELVDRLGPAFEHIVLLIYKAVEVAGREAVIDVMNRYGIKQARNLKQIQYERFVKDLENLL